MGIVKHIARGIVDIPYTAVDRVARDNRHGRIGVGSGSPRAAEEAGVIQEEVAGDEADKSSSAVNWFPL